MRNRVAVSEKMSMLAVLMAVVLLLANCVAFATEPPAVEETPTPEELPWHLIETPYIELQFPKEGSECLVHEGMPFGDEHAEVFYIQMGDVMVPLFRLDFGSAVDGDRLGWLKTEEKNVPVTLTVFPVIEEDFAALGEGSEEAYGTLMMGLNHLLQAMFEDERFTMEEVGGAGMAQLFFGNVELPLQMTWKEVQEDEQYQAFFYGNVQGEDITLYTLRIGDEIAGSDLGYYLLNGALKPVSIEVSNLQSYENWTDDDRETAYQMMETINNVIQALEASEQFSLVKQ